VSDKSDEHPARRTAAGGAELIEHLDEDGTPCTRHAPPSIDVMLGLAMVGSRAPAFHHDTASKLQSLVMAIDEIGEIAEEIDHTDLRRASTTALTALRELHGMFNANRALARPPQATRVPIAELLVRAAERNSITIRGDLPTDQIEVNAQAITHAFSLLLDMSAGVLKLGRVVEMVRVTSSDFLELTIRPPEGASKTPLRSTEQLAVAVYALRRDKGDLRCRKDEGFTFRLPMLTA